MKVKHTIKRIEVIPLKVPLKRKFSGSHYFMTHRCTIITRIITDTGIVGEIYNGDEMDAQEAVMDMIVNRMGPLMIGQDIFSIQTIWKKNHEFTFDILSDRKIALQAVACIDCSLYDAIGKALSIPLHQVWGYSRTKLPVMIIGGYYTDGVEWDKEQITNEMKHFKEMGAIGCKFKVGGRSPEIDALRVEAARKAGGDDFVLAVDANQAWTRMEALNFTNRVKHLNLRWFEEPCNWYNDRAAMRDIRYMSGIPVNAGQSEVSAAGCIELMNAGAIDLCNYDASWGGGATSWLQVAAAGAALGIEMAHHEEPQVAAQLLASAPTGTYMEVFHPDRDPLFYEIVLNRNPFLQGYYEVPTGPGWGIELNPDVVAKYRVDGNKVLFIE
jgi:L-alanine-DL-glutamate epimerase-like enolase superfamily enzyme